MVAILVLITIAVFLTVNGVLRLLTRRQLAESRAVKPRQAVPQPLPAGLFAHPGHTWAEVQRTGQVRLGYDDFVAHAIGRIDRIILRPVGERLRRGEPLLYLERLGRRLALPSPVSGAIVSRNERLTNHPQTPAHTWAYALEPDRLSEEIGGLKVGEQARAWLHAETNRFSAWLTALTPPQPGLALQDGGTPVSGVLGGLDVDGWRDFQRQFLPIDGVVEDSA